MYVGQPTWSNTTPQLVALGPRRIMVSTKLLPPRPKSHEEHDEMARVGRRRGSLPGELRAPIGRDRARPIGLDVGRALLAVEDVVARHVDHARSGRRHLARGVAVPPASSAGRSSAPSTSVNAAQLTTTSGRIRATACFTAAASVTSSSDLASPTTSSPAACTTARPSIPPAPSTRILTGSARPRCRRRRSGRPSGAPVRG